MSKLEKYTSYKYSGVEWLGEIPEGWEVKKLKFISKIVLGKMICNTKTGNMELKPYLKSKNIQWLKVDINSVDKMWFTQQEMKDYRLRVNDIILSEGGEVGKSCIWNNELLECYIQNSAHKVTVNSSCIPHYYLYYFNSIGYKGVFESIVNRVSIGHLTKDKLSNITTPFPPKQEQTKIASFLDEKTSQIDKAISQKEKLIELLKERRQITINEAVTKGLDKYVEFKDSGVEWIGEIPKHWEVSKVKNIFKLIIEPAPKANDEELLSIYTDIGVRPRKDLAEKGNKASTTDGYWRVKKGDFIVNKLLAWMGAIGLSEYEGVTSPAYDILRAKKDIVGVYYHELFRLKVFSQEMKKYSRGIMDMRLRLYFDKFGDILIPYPSHNEQLKIVEYIDNQNEKINKAIELQQNYISKLKEYKASLIDSVVTGKVRV